MRMILIFLSTVVLTGIILAQTMVVKKADGNYEEIAITNSVEISFYQPCDGIPTLDYGGKTYNTVQISNQCWLKENLNIGIRIDGTIDQTNNSIIEKYCYNDQETNCDIYGGFYQWAEAVQYSNNATNISSPSPAYDGNVEGICPVGWHIPTDEEFNTLRGVVSINPQIITAIGQTVVSNNISGFTALLGGYRSTFGGFSDLSSYSYFWSLSEYSNSSMASSMSTCCSGIYTNALKTKGFSIRCLKD